MHPSILAKRKAQAIDRIVQAAQILDPARAEALQPKGVKDLQAVEMMRLEALADLVERLVYTPPLEDALAPEAPTAVTAVTEPVEDVRPTLDDFPAHVVEPAEVEETNKPARKSTSKRTKKAS